MVVGSNSLFHLDFYINYQLRNKIEIAMRSKLYSHIR